MKKINGLQLLIVFFLNLIFIQPAFSEATFVAADKQVSELVDLFEFDTPEQQKHAITLAKALRCPQCQNQNLIESNSPIAKDLRLKVFTMIKEGKDDQYIVEYMTSRFGDFVLYKPPFNGNTWLLWFMPVFIFITFIYLAYKSVNKNK